MRELLPRDCFTDPGCMKVSLTHSQYLIDQNSKSIPTAADSRHKQTIETLWIDRGGDLNDFRRGGPKKSEYVVHNADKTLKFYFEDLRSLVLLRLLKTYAKENNLHKAIKLHAEFLKSGLLAKDIYLGTALLRTYAMLGDLAKAQKVFDELPAWDAVSWTALIAGYADHGFGVEALRCFEQMHSEGFLPDSVTFICLLKACGCIGAMEWGERIHAQLGKHGFLNKDALLGTALMDMYAKCGELMKAREVFANLPTRDVVAWNSLIAGYAQHGLGNEALKCFGCMQDEGLSPDSVTFICALKACSSVGAADKGEEIHLEVIQNGLLSKDIMVGTALVDMYAKCGMLEKAQEVFDELPKRNIISWNALIAGYAQHGLGHEALKIFERMQRDGIALDANILASVLKACGSSGAIEKGEEIHAEASRWGLLKNDVVLGTALVDMYASCGALIRAQKVFDKLPTRDIIMWNALIAGYVQHGLDDAALNCYERMLEEGFYPDAITFICILKVCGSLGASENGEKIYDQVNKRGLLNKDTLLGNTLVDMYAKCGLQAQALRVFDELSAHNVISWNVLITGYSQLGQVNKAFELFSQLLEEGTEPDAVTILVLLTVCSHVGLLVEAEVQFDVMNVIYGILPSLQHNVCMIDLFSRAGRFDRAISMVKKAPPTHCLVLWMALLGACQKWVNVELGTWAFEHLIRLDETFGPAYVCMSNIYADSRM